jgi:hypothetical protein
VDAWGKGKGQCLHDWCGRGIAGVNRFTEKGASVDAAARIGVVFSMASGTEKIIQAIFNDQFAFYYAGNQGMDEV